jgi:histone H3/H4
MEGTDTNSHLTMDILLTAGLTEMLAAKINTAAIDLEAFAKHAGRETINSKDVILLARHNDQLRHVLQEKADALRKRER